MFSYRKDFQNTIEMSRILTEFRVFPVMLVLVVVILATGDTQLLINVKNQGGDVVQENISANVSDDTVVLEFQRSDGTLVTQLIDFRNEVQIIKALILGEEERGQSQYQVVCFVFHAGRDSFISADAMSKLRQRNPGTVRVAEEDRGRTNHTMDRAVLLSRGTIISPHLREMCQEAGEDVYARLADVAVWSSIQGVPEASFHAALKPFPTSANNFIDDANNEVSDYKLPSCTELKKFWAPCECHLEICIGWYPCGLKYCKGKGQSKNSVMTYRCGIKTCRHCRMFAYYVPQKQQCLWDE